MELNYSIGLEMDGLLHTSSDTLSLVEGIEYDLEDNLSAEKKR